MRRLNLLLYYKVGVHTSYWKKKILFPKNSTIKIIVNFS